MFQSTFPQGERLACSADCINSDSFNPRSRKGNDFVCAPDCPGFHVSIHVPARGTTLQPGRTASLHTGFNPRSRKGNDDYRDVPINWIGKFQSTFPQGERPSFTSSIAARKRFNPRSRKGNDERLNLILTQIIQFQSTFPQGERHSRQWQCHTLI